MANGHNSVFYSFQANSQEINVESISGDIFLHESCTQYPPDILLKFE